MLFSQVRFNLLAELPELNNDAAYDVLEIRRGSESVRAVTGFLSAALGLHQAWSA